MLLSCAVQSIAFLSDFQIALVLLNFCEQFGEVCGFGLLWNRHNLIWAVRSAILIRLYLRFKAKGVGDPRPR